MTSPGETPSLSVAAELAEQQPDTLNFLRNGLRNLGRLAARSALGLSLAISGGAVMGTVAEIVDARPLAAVADTGGYPDWEAPCVANNNNVKTGTGYWCNDYQWGYYLRNDQGQVIGNSQNSSRGYAYRNCTDWVAWRIPQLNVGTVPTGWGNGGNWDNAAMAAGKTVDTTPEPGDIAVWDPTTPGGLGHVAVVESVNSDGTVNVSEYNKTQDGTYGTRSNIKANHYIDLNGTGNGIGNASTTGNGQELTDGSGVYTTAGGSYWYIKPKSEWTDSDAAYWGGGTLAQLTTSQIHEHEAGYTDSGRTIGAHPPVDGTAVFVAGGNGQQYYFFRGNAYPITSAELDDLGVRNQAQPIPATGSRLSDFLNRSLRLYSGEMYRFAGLPEVRQVINTPSGDPWSYYVNNDTVKDCLRITQGKNVALVPQSAGSYLVINNSNSLAGCSFPGNMILFGPGGAEQWRIEGNNPYVRRRYFTPLDTYLNTNGNPQYATLGSTASLNNIPEGSAMTPPEGVALENIDNGQIFVYKNGDFHLVPWPEMVNCLGISNSIIRLPGGIVGALHQGTQMTCQYENRVVATSGSNYYLEGGKAHKIATAAAARCIIARRGTGPVVDIALSTLQDYAPSSEAFCPYPVTFFAYYSGYPTIWKVNKDGTIQHVGQMCVPDYMTTQLSFWRAQQLPLDELGGYKVTNDWFADTAGCYAIRDEWINGGYY